jgi:cell division inhibitor SepF
MAGAMRKMGIYLGLVEDDDTRAYGRYDARQSDDRYDDRRYGRYLPEDGYDDGHLEGRDHYEYYEEELAAPEPPPAPEPVVLRRGGSARSLGVAPAAGSTAAGRLAASSPAL